MRPLQSNLANRNGNNRIHTLAICRAKRRMILTFLRSEIIFGLGRTRQRGRNEGETARA